MEVLQSFFQITMAIAGVGLAIAFFIWLMILLPIRMAKKRGRNPVGWTLLFWILHPLIGIILLLILGDSKEKIRKDILDELKDGNE